MSDVSPTQIFSIYIKTTPDRVWEAITDPKWTEKYMYSSTVDYDLRPGGHYIARPTEEFRRKTEAQGLTCPEIVADGEVIESNPPNKLVQTWRMVADPEAAAEGFTRLTFDIVEVQPDVTKLTVIHELQSAPKHAQFITGAFEQHGAGGGWSEILSGLKSLLETGEGLKSR